MGLLWRLLKSVPLVLLSPILLLFPLVVLALTDLLQAIRRRAELSPDKRPSSASASVVIPNWNGRDLLEKYLPSLIDALQGHPDNEVIVVDNGSTDGSTEFVRKTFPSVRILALPKNLGFGGGCNAGFQAARNDIVVLLNSDMRVTPGFLQPLLEGFTDSRVFAVSCQIFFTNPDQPRQETGLTEGWWNNGSLRVRHRVDNSIDGLFPCFYGGGGSSAFDRKKFLELGSFDPLLAPFYLEDTDLGYLSWKRGWKVLYQPASHVYHEHRGTIGKKFSEEQIQAVLHKNFILFAWKNIHEWPRLLSHFGFTFAGGLVSALFGGSPERATFSGLWRAFLQLPRAVRSRWAARSLAAVNDTEAFRRPYGGYFRDRFQKLDPRPEPLNVLFVSPYPICPPTHGGGVFMYQTCLQLARQSRLHLAVNIDRPDQQDDHAELVEQCASAEFFVRLNNQRKTIGALEPHAVTEFANPDLNWLIHRTIYQREIDVLQLEYMPMGQYGGQFRQLACVLFEHDIYFQSVGRSLSQTRSWSAGLKPFYEYMRALRYELKLLPSFDRVQVCSPQNAAHLTSFLPAIRDRLDDDLRSGIDTSRYQCQLERREPRTMLFLGSFRHLPNLAALDWMAREVMPIVLAGEPTARLVVVGSDPPARHSFPDLADAIELRGFVEDVLEPLSRYALFVCPILTGSGIRVKLLEAFASGIPVVSTRLGAEGLASKDGEICALADDPDGFAQRIIALFRAPQQGTEMARRARNEVEQRDIRKLTTAMVEGYRRIIAEKRGAGA